MNSMAQLILGRIEQAISVVDVEWAGGDATKWAATEGFLGLLLQWGRYQLRLIEFVTVDLSPFGSVSPSEKFVLDLWSYRLRSPKADDWSPDLVNSYDLLTRHERYRVMRVLENSRILEPIRLVDGIAAFATGKDDRASWPCRSGNDEVPFELAQLETDPVRKQKAEASALIALGASGIEIVARYVDRILEEWSAASKGASSRDMKWSLGHQRIVDASVFATVLAIQTEASLGGGVGKS